MGCIPVVFRVPTLGHEASWFANTPPKGRRISLKTFRPLWKDMLPFSTDVDWRSVVVEMPWEEVCSAVPRVQGG